MNSIELIKKEVFKDYYEEHKEEVENLLMKIGAVLFEIKM